MKCKLIACDMDGTLLDSNHVISQKNIDAVKRCSEKGIKFVLCTGRPVQAIESFRAELGLNTPVIAYNGSKIVDPESNEDLYCECLSEENVEKILALAEENESVVTVWADDKLYINKTTTASKLYAKLANETPVAFDLADRELFRGKKINKILWIQTAEEAARLLPSLKSALPSDVSCFTSNPEYIEFVNSKVSKGRALSMLCKKLGIDVNETVAIGDGENDIDLLKTAGMGIAVANASDNVKKAADKITSSNDENGVARVIYAITKSKKKSVDSKPALTRKQREKLNAEIRAKRRRKKAEYIDIKGIFKPSVIIMSVLIMVLSFVALKLIVDGIALRNNKSALTGDSILGESNYNAGNTDFEVKDIKEISQGLATLKSTHTEWTNFADDPQQNGFFCIATGSADKRLVYNLDPKNICNMGYSLSDFKYIWVDSVNTGFYAVINIPGEVVDLTDYYILVHNDTGNLASRLIINCYEARVVKLKNTILTGTLLAPDATVEYDGTSVYGQVYANAYTGTRSFYKDIPFGGYSIVIEEIGAVDFMNVAIRANVLKWLKENYPEIYAGHSDDYRLNTVDLTYVTELILDDVMIADLGDDLKYFKNLKKLSVKRTKMTSLDVSFISELEELDISETEISEVTFAKNNSLKVLKADRTKLAELDMSLLEGLKELSISENNFTVMPDVYSLVNLTVLNVSKNKCITSFEFSSLAKLEKLNISECSLTELNLNGAKALKELHCSYNSIRELDLTPAGSLTYCEAYGTSFKSINAAGMNVRVSCHENATVIK